MKIIEYAKLFNGSEYKTLNAKFNESVLSNV